MLTSSQLKNRGTHENRILLYVITDQVTNQNSSQKCDLIVVVLKCMSYHVEAVIPVFVGLS